MFGRVRFLEAELVRKDEIINDLLNRLMARDFGQYQALRPDSFLAQDDEPRPTTMTDSTGLISFDVED